MQHRETDVQKYLKLCDNVVSECAYPHALNLYLLIDAYFMLSLLLGAGEPCKILSLKEHMSNYLTKSKVLTNIYQASWNKEMFSGYLIS